MAYRELSEGDDLEALEREHAQRKAGGTPAQEASDEPDTEVDVETDESEIEVVDDTPPADRGREYVADKIDDPTEEELAAYSEKVQKRLRALTRAREDERRRAEALTREKAELERATKTLYAQQKQMQEYITMGQTAYIDKAKLAATLAADSAKAKLREAYDRGDSEAIAAAQEALTSAQLQLQEANNFRPAPLQMHEEPAYTPNQEQSQSAQSTPQVDEMTRGWVAKNPWFQKDTRMTHYAMGVHADLVAQYGADYTRTPEYFEDIDREMRKVFPDRFKSDQAPAATRKPSTVVAPAQRASSAKKKIRLTQTQVNIAKQLGISLEDYAKQMAALEKDNG